MIISIASDTTFCALSKKKTCVKSIKNDFNVLIYYSIQRIFPGGIHHWLYCTVKLENVFINWIHWSFIMIFWKWLQDVQQLITHITHLNLLLFKSFQSSFSCWLKRTDSDCTIFWYFHILEEKKVSLWVTCNMLENV